jgi:phosphoserine phosphatase
MTTAASPRYRLVIWDFDGTLIPFDSEQFLLETVALRGLRRLGARLFVYADRRGWDPGALKVLYGWCLRGTPIDAVELVSHQIAGQLTGAEGSALRALSARAQMAVLSCGTADLSRGTLHAAGLEDAFVSVEANALEVRDSRIRGIERQLYTPEAKVAAAARYGVPWKQIIAVGDGLTDLPLLDRVGLPILIAKGETAGHLAKRKYQVVDTLGDAIRLVAQHL